MQVAAVAGRRDVSDARDRVASAIPVICCPGRQIDADQARYARVLDRIVATAAVKHVVAGAADQQVVAGATRQYVVPGTAINDDGMARGENRSVYRIAEITAGDGNHPPGKTGEVRFRESETIRAAVG